MPAELVKFPDVDVSDISSRLRTLAQEIEVGKFGDAHILVWVVDCGDGRIEVGAMGQSPSIGAESHLMLGMAMRKIESVGK